MKREKETETDLMASEMKQKVEASETKETK
jgi:hypothetical protein